MTDTPASTPDEIPPADKKAKLDKWRGLAIAAAALIFGWWWFGMPGLPDGLTEDDLTAIKTNISAEYEKRGHKPTEVQMMRKGSHEAIGFVKMQLPVLGEVTRACTANLSDDGPRRFMWHCD